MQDLEEASKKAIAAGMGDWDLQPLEQQSAGIRSRVFKGPLGPEVLKHEHGLSPDEILSLYRLMETCCSGFHRGVGDIVGRAKGAQRLLESVWRGYAQLWEEIMQVRAATQG
jgi:hypothetical protein